MARIGKKLHYKKDGTTYDINLYDSISDVGSMYITLKVDSKLVYAQVGVPGTQSTTSLMIQKSGTNNTLAVRSTVEDQTIVSTGTITNTGNLLPAPTTISGTYSGDGQNVTKTWKSVSNWTVMPDSQLVARYTVTINPSLTLGDTHHYRIKYGTDMGAVTTDGGTIVPSARTFTLDLRADILYFITVAAEDVNNNVLYISPVFGPLKSNWPTTAASGITYSVYKTDSAGNNAVKVGDYGSAVGTSPKYDNDNLTRKWFYVTSTTTHPYPGDTGIRKTSLACADTCSCNCNYCTCNCNYCTCNCNYCTCNCDYYPCSCSSCSCGTC